MPKPNHGRADLFISHSALFAAGPRPPGSAFPARFGGAGPGEDNTVGWLAAGTSDRVTAGGCGGKWGASWVKRGLLRGKTAVFW